MYQSGFLNLLKPVALVPATLLKAEKSGRLSRRSCLNFASKASFGSKTLQVCSKTSRFSDGLSVFVGRETFVPRPTNPITQQIVRSKC